MTTTNETPLRTSENMAAELLDRRTKSTRQLALAPGLTFPEVEAYVAKWRGAFEEFVGVVEYR